MVHGTNEPKPTDNAQFLPGGPVFKIFANTGFHFPDCFICSGDSNNNKQIQAEHLSTKKNYEKHPLHIRHLQPPIGR